MLVDEAMTKKVLTVEPDTKLEALLSTYRHDEISRLVYVVDKKEGLLGIISSFDILTKLVGGTGLNKLLGRRTVFDIKDGIEQHKHLTAADLMITNYLSVAPYENVTRAMEIISQKRILALPVASDNKLRGEISRYSILRAIARAGMRLPLG
ncbi:CBS domain-containing protein [Desulfocurvibacter africanus]|uniref:CBS domain containing protein n=1 Tax=Desulfocurvibacter africanus subsp. africanus str. Walvis Bay TaxID=690850 RepID=F3YV84_DESAF|nr:CBS domain-containing protein [Desulfocurvibacter africanus]EGJ48402.1 CBS domain containing protein [Desulfocurvibacter africanus subsp. africanus str. Walvis Bay]